MNIWLPYTITIFPDQPSCPSHVSFVLALRKCSSYGLLYHLYPSLPTIQVARSASPCRSPNFEPGGEHPILGVYTFLDMRKWVEAIQFLVFLAIFRENQESPHMTSSAFCVAALHQLHPAQHASYRSTSAILTLKRKTFEVSPIPLLCLKMSEAFSRFNPNCDNIFIGLVWGKWLTGNPCFTPRKKDQKRSKRWVFNRKSTTNSGEEFQFLKDLQIPLSSRALRPLPPSKSLAAPCRNWRVSQNLLCHAPNCQNGIGMAKPWLFGP